MGNTGQYLKKSESGPKSLGLLQFVQLGCPRLVGVSIKGTMVETRLPGPLPNISSLYVDVDTPRPSKSIYIYIY